MPNWCYNSLSVSGTKEALDEFLAEFYRKPVGLRSPDKIGSDNWVEVDVPECYAFWNIVSPPEFIRDEYFSNKELSAADFLQSDNWYDWNVRNWGTKWDIAPDDTRFERQSDTELTGFFPTAWSPPVEFLIRASKRFHTLTFEMSFEEESMDYAGEVLVRNGRVVKDATYTIDHDYRIEHHDYCSECMWFAGEHDIDETYAEDSRACEMTDEELVRFAELHPVASE